MLKRLIALLLLLLALAPTALAEDEIIRYVPEGAPLPFLDTPGSLWVFCVPIGAQDAYLLVCEGHAAMLDCGAVGREPRERYLLDLLNELGIRRLDWALNTHPHADHCGGFAELMAAVPTDVFYTPFPAEYDKLQIRLLKEVDAVGVPVRPYRAGEPLPLGGARIDTFRYRESLNTNDLSLVLRVQYGERSLLLTADIGRTPQRKMAVEYGARWQSDILKIPHHGVGKPAKELLDIVQPRLCFISNIRNKSSRSSWEYLDKRGFPVLFTARQMLALTTDGQVWAVEQWPEFADVPELLPALTAAK